MRKMITALCVLAVAVGSMMAAVNMQNAEPIKTARVALNDKDAPVNFDKYTNGFTESSSFDLSAHGYGWLYGFNKKIAWSPEDNMYSSAYRQKNVAGSGTIAGMTGNWTDGNIPLTIQAQDATINARYPSISAMDKYAFATYNHNAAGNSAYISVYDKDEETWTPSILIKNADGTSMNNAWCGTSDVTKDADGNYRLFTSWEYEGLNPNGSKQLCVSVGKSATPFDVNSWTWTDYTALTLSAGTGGQFFELERYKTVWGKNGFGLALVIGTEDETSMTRIYYAYTKDYGQTWIKDADGKFFKVNVEYPFVGKYYASDAGDVVIEQGFTIWNTDAFIDENNDVHMLCKAIVGEGTNVLLGIEKATDGSPVDGFWQWTGKFDALGNPEAGDWTPDFVAHYVGWAETDNQPLDAGGTAQVFEWKSSNRHTMSMSYCGNGTIVASWLDRSETDAMLAETVGTSLGATWDADILFMLDPYVIVSTDYGKTWQYSDAALKRAHHIKVNPDQKVLEEGFTVSPRGVKTGQTIEMYAAYQKANYQQLGAGITAAAFPGDYEQNMHVLKMLINPVGIESQDVTEGKTVELAQNYPNPFNPTTTINFNLQTSANVKLSVFNAQGQEVANLINAKMTSGAHTANFNAANLNSGVYFYKLSVDGQSAVKKMVLTK